MIKGFFKFIVTIHVYVYIGLSIESSGFDSSCRWIHHWGHSFLWFLCFSLVCSFPMVCIIILLGFYGVLYPDKKSSAYSICKLSIASGEAIAFAYGNSLCQRTKVFIIMCLYAVGMLFFRNVYGKHKERESKQVRKFPK